MKKVYSICTCGCNVERADLVKNKQHRNSCPEHGGTVISRFTTCDICGARRDCSKGGVVPKHCIPHQEEIDVKKRREFTKQYYLKNRHKVKKSMRKKYNHLRDNTRFDCLHRFDCLGKYDKFDSIPCKGCKDYHKVNFL